MGYFLDLTYCLYLEGKFYRMRNYTFSLLLIFAGLFVQAQDFGYGILGGVNFSNLDNFADEDGESLVAFHAGIIAEIPVADKFSFEPSVVYSVEGETVSTDNGDFDLQVTYLNIPVHMKYYIFDGFSVHAGPMIQFYLSGELDGEDLDDSEGLFNPTTSAFAATGGVAYDFDFGLFIKATYNHGVTDIFESTLRIDPAERTRSFQASIGFKF